MAYKFQILFKVLVINSQRYFTSSFKKMGAGSSDQYAKKQKVISLISLNYSGILLSPFEFFSKQNKEMTEIETSLSNIYKSLLKSYTNEFSENKKDNKFKWNLGKIDQKMQAQRYSPLYNKNVGIENNKMIDENRFKSIWQETFKKNVEILKKRTPEFQYKQSQMKQAMEFDLLCYKCILSYVNKKQFKSLTAQQVQALDAKKYLAFMDRMFNKSFLNEEKKLEKTLLAMKKQNIDIVFAQQANETLIQILRQMDDYVFFSRKGSDSIIIVKKQKFRNFYTLRGRDPLQHLPEIEKQLLWNDDTVVAFVDNLILISGHLSSKKDKNPKQVYNMMQSLRKLHALYPMCHIIVGCDANSFVPKTFNDYCKQQKIEYNFDGTLNTSKESIENSKITDEKLNDNWKRFKPRNCFVYPSNPEEFTTSKERTYLQPQVSKAEEVARVCRDHLIIFMAEDIKVDKATVCTILDQSPHKVVNLPCEDHPYDHYVVKGFLTVNVLTHFGNEAVGGSGCI